jgi:hypothetical protein
MHLVSVVPGWVIGYLVVETDEVCEYRTLSVIGLIGCDDGGVEPVVVLPDGRTVRASDVGPSAFAVATGEDVNKVAQAHAASRGRRVSRYSETT